MRLTLLIKKTIIYKIYLFFRYRTYRKHQAELARTLKAEGSNLLIQFSCALNEVGIPFWLDYGTLLGYQREHDFIKHDNDLDTGAFVEDAEKIKDALTKSGFKLVRHYHTIDNEYVEHCYCHVDSNITIDVFLYRRKGDTLYGTCFSPKDEPFDSKNHLFEDVPFKTVLVQTPFTGLNKTTFKGADVYVPTNIDAYLKANYGENYMVPDPGFSFRNAPNIKILTYEEKPAVGYLELPY